MSQSDILMLVLVGVVFIGFLVYAVLDETKGGF